MTKHYQAKHEGVIFKRSTQNRTYTHMVVGHIRITDARIECEKRARASWKLNLKFRLDMIEGRRTVHIIPATGFHPSRGMLDANGAPTDAYAQYVAEQKLQHALHVADIAKEQAKGEEGAVADDLAVFDAKRAKATNISADGLDYLWSAGWCGRLDLAMKLASKTEGGVIVEATEVRK